MAEPLSYDRRPGEPDPEHRERVRQILEDATGTGAELLDVGHRCARKDAALTRGLGELAAHFGIVRGPIAWRDCRLPLADETRRA